MILVVGYMDERMRKFIRKAQFHEPFMVIQKMCYVKKIHEPVVLFLPYAVVMPDTGLISSTFIPMEELLMSISIKKIYYGNAANKETFEKLQNKYGVEFVWFDLQKGNETKDY